MLVALLVRSHYLNQCYNIVNSTIRNKLQWNNNRNSNSFIQENAFQNVLCEMAAILSRLQYVQLKSREILFAHNLPIVWTLVCTEHGSVTAVTSIAAAIFRPYHDDVIKWKHFPRNWPFVREIHRSPVNFPHKGQWRGALMFSLIYVWINDWVNNREAGDLRRQHGHYDVIVMPSVHLTMYMI